MKRKKWLLLPAGLFIGCMNGLLGAGGGMLAVPLLQKCGMKPADAHANAVAVMLPVTALSCLFYSAGGYLPLRDAGVYLPTGIFGALCGTWLLQKIKPALLQRLFGGLMIYAGVRLLWR